MSADLYAVLKRDLVSRAKPHEDKMNERSLLLFVLLGATSLCLTACPPGDDDDAANDDDATSDDDDATEEPLNIYGVFDEGFGSGVAVTELGWLTWSEFGTSRYDLTQLDVDPGSGSLIAQNSSENEYNPGLWSRFDFFGSAQSGYFCQSSFDAASEEDAVAATPADPENLKEGCGGFGWSTITPSSDRIAIAGIHLDSYGGDNKVTDKAWTVGTGDSAATFEITQYDNASGFAIAENGAENEYNPGLWSRFDYVEYEGDWWVCTTAYAAASEQEAAETPASDATDPSSGGCGGTFAWTNLTP